ncbi:hypothetical protein I4U23_022420 [Adineta vaga]|nr:hypothetical protein I4U23_022420 [Adineta vaga]
MQTVIQSKIIKIRVNFHWRTSTLTWDQSAAIYLYSMPDRNALKTWLLYLKLFITAFEKLPSCQTTV